MPENDWPLEGEDLRTFQALPAEDRALVLRMIGAHGPITEEDHQALQDHPNGKMLATWLLTLPAYRNARSDEED